MVIYILYIYYIHCNMGEPQKYYAEWTKKDANDDILSYHLHTKSRSCQFIKTESIALLPGAGGEMTVAANGPFEVMKMS